MVATRNRIARHLNTPPVPPPKEDYKGRYEFVSDAVLRAVAAVTRLLGDDDPAVVLKAAKMILDVEKTRMRHGRDVHGAPSPESVERSELLGPLPGAARPAKVRHDDDFEEEDFDDEPVIRPIPDIVGNTPATPVVARSTVTATEPPLRKDSEHATGGEPSEFQLWLKGFHAQRFPGVSAIPLADDAWVPDQHESGSLVGPHGGE